MYTKYIYIVATLYLFAFVHASPDYDHKEQHLNRVNLYSQLLKRVKLNNDNISGFTKADIQILLTKLSFKICSETVTRIDCRKCFTVDDIFHDLSITSDIITEADFNLINIYIIIKQIDGACFNTDEDDHDSHKDKEEDDHDDRDDHDDHTSHKYKEDLKDHDDHDDNENHEDHDDHKNESEINDENLPNPDYFMNFIFKQFGNKTHLTEKGFYTLLETLKLGKPHDEDLDEEDDHKGHDHRKKRSTILQKRTKRDAVETNETSNNAKCYSGKNILKVFGVHGSIDAAMFMKMCPALIQQLNSGICQSETHDKNEDATETGSDWKPWIGALTSTFIISLGSLAGIIAAPFSKKPYFNYILMFLICLAISTLICDAILHLLPHSLGLHKHEPGEHDHSGENEVLKEDSFLWKFIFVLAGIYVFFNFEILMHAFGSKHGHSHGVGNNIDILDESHKHVGPTDTIHAESVKGSLQMNEDIVNPYLVDCDGKSSIIQGLSGIHECTNENFDETDSCKISNGNNDKVVKYCVGSEDSSISSLDGSEKPFMKKKSFSRAARNFKSVVWMVLIGDAIHNFMDGIAIGVAFTEPWPSGLHGGLSTSIAILCHELPHELGDFAILINSGMTIKQALLMNFISSTTSFGGTILGVVLGTQWNAVPWLFAMTCGLFVYIALVDMLPEMIHNTLLKARPYSCFLLQNLGLLVGFLMMFSLAAWEEDIKTFLT